MTAKPGQRSANCVLPYGTSKPIKAAWYREVVVCMSVRQQWSRESIKLSYLKWTSIVLLSCWKILVLLLFKFAPRYCADLGWKGRHLILVEQYDKKVGDLVKQLMSVWPVLGQRVLMEKWCGSSHFNQGAWIQEQSVWRYERFSTTLWVPFVPRVVEHNTSNISRGCCSKVNQLLNVLINNYFIIFLLG